MSEKIFNKLLRNFEEKCEEIGDRRRQGHNLRYKASDFVKSAFNVFFFQHPSLLDYQRKMQEKKGRSNIETVMGVSKLPSDTRIRTMMDRIEPASLGSLFNSTLRIADESGLLESYRVLDGGVLIALDGVWYHRSQNIQCQRCLTQTKAGETTYYHSALAATLVKPGNSSVLPVMAEMICNGEGNKKQDCELTAAKRWLTSHGQEYAWLKPTLLGDDLYSHEPFCLQVLSAGYSFIFTCKETTHSWLNETVANSVKESTTDRQWDGRTHVEYRYRWVNGVPIRYKEKEEQTLMVNYLEMEIWHEKKQKRTYYNSWITDKTINEQNVKSLCACARARWKVRK